MRSFLQILRLSQRQSGAHWSQQGFQNLKKSRLSFFDPSSHAAIATSVNNNSSSREYNQEKKVVSRKSFSIFSLILTQEEKRHFVYFGIAGAVLAAVVASKTSFKAEASLDEEAVTEFILEEPKKQDEPTKDFKENPRKSCVICVGSTGTGKSTLIKIMTGADIEISSRANSVTKTSSVFTKKRGLLGLRGRKPLQYWIDTQGWEDSDIEKQDNQIFKDIFQVTFQDNKIFKNMF